MNYVLVKTLSDEVYLKMTLLIQVHGDLREEGREVGDEDERSHVYRMKRPRNGRYITNINIVVRNLRIDYCGFGPFSSTLANLVILISLFKVLVFIVH